MAAKFIKVFILVGDECVLPSSGGGPELKGSWDVIHFTFGVLIGPVIVITIRNITGATRTCLVRYGDTTKSITLAASEAKNLSEKW